MKSKAGTSIKIKTTKLRNKCKSGKFRFRDHRECVRVLHAATNQRVIELAEGGESRRREIRSYACGLCSGWHVTSSETWDTRDRKVA